MRFHLDPGSFRIFLEKNSAGTEIYQFLIFNGEQKLASTLCFLTVFAITPRGSIA